MRFSYAESMCDPKQYFPLAIAAERAGHHSFCVPDSILYPEASDTRYPYTTDGGREFLEGNVEDTMRLEQKLDALRAFADRVISKL